MNNKVIIPIIVGIIVLSLGISLHRISSKSAELQYDFLSKSMADPSGMESADDKSSENYGNTDAFDAESSDAILFIERKISSLEACKISAGSIVLEIPMGAVSSEKDLTVRGLRGNELPELDYGLVNVTSTYGGYRCLPHGKFNKPLQLSIGYDTSLIPAGYRPDDIRTFFYDEDQSQWVCMPIDSIDHKHQLVVTSTDHFTDFINGILTQPEIPDASGYANTSIRGIEYANPLEGMTIMQAPTANNSGNCSMNYPIQIPAGRNGMAPQISISYSSDVKDGIMGPGWSLSIPSITVDTRWGVPLYSADVESESYLVNGEAIVESEEDPNTTIITRHKPLYVERGGERGAEKTYAYLNEGKFDKIKRHGDSPKNYWWEVTDRNGVNYIYGDKVQEENTALRFSLAGDDPDDNIAVWGLAKMKDLYGNTVEYVYDIETETEDESMLGLRPLAKQMRVSEIIYTSREYEDQQLEAGKYHVIFEYDETPVTPSLLANYGFFTSDMRMLSKITVTYDNNFVKCYRFKYEVAGSLNENHGNLPKRRLVAIAEITDPGMENQNFDDIQRQGFYVHTFDYFSDDEISFEEGTPLSMSVGEPAVVYGSQVEETEELSNLSKNTSYAINVGGSASVGFVDAMPMLKNNSIGVNYHYSYDINNQKTQIIDLNGDGVVDRVEKNGDIIKFYKGYISDGNYVSFVDRPHSLTIPRLGKSASKTNSVGIELFFNQFVKGQIGGNYSMTKTINSDYFLDVNGDGFVDFVSGNTVYINFPDNEGIPQFTDWENDPEQRSRYDQCYKFEYDGNVDMSMEPDKKEAKRDAVILWRNPLPMGHPFHIYFKVADYTHDEYGTRGSCVMGYNVYKADSLLFYSEEYPFQDARFYKDCGIHEYNVFIPKDGHILFHVHSNSEETIDIFNAFSIEIIPRYPLIDEHTPQQIVNYVGQIGANSTDADDKPLLHYEYNADAVVQDGSAFYSTFDGEVNFSVSLHATRPKSDTLEFFVVHNKHIEGDTYTRVVLEEYSEVFLSNDNVQDIPSVEIINASLPVGEQDQLLFELRSNSNVDWSDISFSSSVKYVGENVQDRETYHPSLNMSIYSNQLCMSRPYNLRPGRYIVTPNSELVNHLRSNNQDAEIYLTVKTLNQNKVKRLLLNGQEELSFTLPRGRDFYNVYFDYTIKNINSEFAEDDEEYDYYANSKVAVRNASSNVPLSYFAGLYAKHPAKKIYMGGNMYRGWGQFSYLDTLIVKTPVDVQEGITPDGVAEIYPYEAIPFHLFNFDKIYATEDELHNIVDDSRVSIITSQSDNNHQNDDYAQNLEDYVNNGPLSEYPLMHMFVPMLTDLSNERWMDPFRSAFVKPNHNAAPNQQPDPVYGSIGSGIGLDYARHEFENMQQNSDGFAEHGDALPNFDDPLGSRHFPVVNKVSKTQNLSFSASINIINSDQMGYNHTNTWTKGFSDMMDMNGDGYPDIVGVRQIQYTLPNGDMSNNIFRFADEHEDVYTSYSKGKSNGGSISFKPNIIKGKGTSPESTEMNIPSMGLNTSASENNVLDSYIDVNSDGLPDIVTFNDDEDRYYVEYNMGYKFSKRYPISITPGHVSSNKSNSSLLDLLNNLWQFLPLPMSYNTSNFSFSGGINVNSNKSFDNATMMDINSDGLVDIVEKNGSGINVYYNNGRGFYAMPISVNNFDSDLSNNHTHNISVNGSGSVGFPVENLKVTASLYADFLYTISKEKTRVMDINGDGAVDILNFVNSSASVKYGKPMRRDILKKVTTPAFGEYEISYSLLYPNADNPHSKWLMSELTVLDNDGDFEDGSDYLHYQFEYSGMKYHRIERESYGFAEVTTRIVNHDNSEELRKQKEYYITENGLRHGLKYRDEVLDARDVLQTSTDYNWTLNDLNTGEVVADYECGSEQEVYPRLESEQTIVYGSNELVSVKHYKYGKYGNITSYTNNYRPDEYVKAEMTYVPNRTKNLLDMMSEMTVKSADNQLLRKFEREYTENGKIFQVRNFVTENTWESTMYTYEESNGNLIGVTYPNRMFYIYTYDDATHTYLSNIGVNFINDQNHTEAWLNTTLEGYDYRFGKPTVITAPNGTRMVYTYYSDGKINTITGPMDQEYSLKFKYWDELRNRSPRWARVIHKDAINRGNTFVTQTVCDGLGRTMQTARKSVVDRVEKFVASGKNVYDDYGRVVGSYQPAEVTVNTEDDGFLQTSFENPTKYTYDCMDRVLTTLTPDGKFIEKSYDVSEDALGQLAMLVTTRDPLGRELMSYTDSRGLQTTTKQASESDGITTKFIYSPMGELVASIDPEDNSTKYYYDMLGRLVSRYHPDAGHTSYTYSNGNLISKVTQKLENRGEEVNYVYMGDRLKEIHYPNNSEMDVYYEYGGINDGMSAGLVTKRQDGVRVQEYFYNEMGDIVKDIRTFAMPDGQLMLFKTMWTYDTWGRIMDMTYPDGETVRYRYDNAGKLESMISSNMNSRDDIIIGDIRYDKYGHRINCKYGNGAYNRYEYNELSLQLEHMSSFAGDGCVLQDIHYQYDDVYNIVGISNDGDFQYSYEYMYDNLNRLVKSDGRSNGLDAGYHFEMSYSPAGNIRDYILNGHNNIDGEVSVFDRRDGYAYENPQKPHAVTKIGPNKYLWDANGNIKRCIVPGAAPRPEVRELYFNEENRLAAISDRMVDENGRQMSRPSGRGAVAAYLYDADGERVWKFSGMVTDAYRNERLMNRDIELDKTFYPTQQITIDNRSLYKHYFVGEERICTEIVPFAERDYYTSGVEVINNRTERDFISGLGAQVQHALDSVGYRGDIVYARGNYVHFDPVKFYYHYNHQGSVSALTDRQGGFYQHLQYMPYGEVLVDKHRDRYVSPYTFSAKEKDSESGYNYFGARYYTDNIMMWLSVDPMSDKYPSMSPYMYCAGNPVMLRDPDGRKIDGVTYNKKTKKFEYSQEAKERGTERYINARTLTKCGTRGVMRMLRSRKMFYIHVTDKPMFIEDNDGETNGYSRIPGIAENNHIYISTYYFGDKKDNDYSSSILINPDGSSTDISADPSNVLSGNSDRNDVYSDAYRDSELEKFDKMHPYRSIEEYIHGNGAHEETHLFQSKYLRNNCYKSEYPAMCREVYQRKQFIKTYN